MRSNRRPHPFYYIDGSYKKYYKTHAKSRTFLQHHRNDSSGWGFAGYTKALVERNKGQKHTFYEEYLQI